MPTQVMFERARSTDALGANPEAASSTRRAAAAAERDGRRMSNCRCTTISHRSRTTGARSRRSADCTVFQTFDWLSTWFRNIGVREGVKPAVVIGRHGGTMLFLLPFALETDGFARKITWLGSCLSNYNGPLVAKRFFAAHRARRNSPRLWREVEQLLRQCGCGHDLIDLEKMPKVIGEQTNPFCALRRHAARQRRLSDGARRRLGNLLRREALVGHAQDRPQEAQAPRRSRRDSLRHRRRSRRRGAHASMP